MRCAIWYHLYNLNNVKNTHGGVLILILKLTLFHGCFSRFLNRTNRTKSRNASHMKNLRELFLDLIFDVDEDLFKDAS